MFPKAILSRVIAVCIALFFIPTGASAAFPEKPIQFLIGWQAGNGTDLAARAVCTFAEKHLPHPIVPSNLAGGSGGKAYTAIAAAKPDGYTLGNTTSSIAVLKTMGLVNVGAEDVQPVIAFSEDPTGVWVHYDAPWKTLAEFVAHAKANPGTVKVASSTPGSITRFQVMALEQAAGIEFRVLSIDNAPGMIAAAGGHVDAAFGTPPTGASLYQSKKIRPLGFTSPKRLSYMSEVPTFAEQGFDVVITTVRMVIGPKAMPKELVDSLYQIFKKATDDPAFRKTMENMGISWLDWDPATCRAYMEKETAMYADLIKKSGLAKTGSK